MNQDSTLDLKQYRTLLLARRDALLGSTDADAAATVELDQTRQGRLSRMDALQQQAMAAAMHQRSTTELARINAGDYGYCLRCDAEIAPGRLRTSVLASA